jgi:CheY-like chemotaxis protein
MRKHSILCVDDEELGLRVRKLTLESNGYEVITASSGRSALDLFSSRDFDLSILDYSMPGMNGGELAAAMRKMRPHSRIVLLSAYVALPPEYVELADAFLVKSANPLDFLGRVQEILSQRERS